MHLDHIDDNGTLSAWTADEVRDAAEHLRAVPYERLDRQLDPDTDEPQYLRWHYENLVRFFDAAAVAGDAAIMSTG